MLGDNVGDAMLDACRDTLTRLSTSERRLYTGVPALETGEYLSIPLDAEEDDEQAVVAELAALIGEDAGAAAELIQLVGGAFENDNFLSRDELQGGRWLFYAVVGEVESEPVAFVRQYNPQRGIRAGRLLTSFHNALTRFTDPVFNFDLDFDLVVSPEEIVVLSTTAFDRLFADIDLAAAQVPAQVVELNAALGVNLAAGAADFLSDTVRGRAALVRRFRRVARLDHLAAVTYETMSDALDKHGLPRDRFGAGPELDLQNTEDVNVFLDMLEELYYETDWSNEHRRADRYSSRG